VKIFPFILLLVGSMLASVPVVAQGEDECLSEGGFWLPNGLCSINLDPTVPDVRDDNPPETPPPE